MGLIGGSADRAGKILTIMHDSQGMTQVAVRVKVLQSPPNSLKTVETMTLDLAVVMPVYNEQDCIVEVVQSWLDALTALNLNFQLLVLNDGSKDQTAQALQTFSDDQRVRIIHKRNSGHGPTILVGYHQAVELAPWVFQCDSDDEMKPDHFAAMWAKRDDYDALFGMRDGREQNAGRKIISAVSRLTVQMLFGSGVRDVNVPYRLMRSEFLRPIIRQIPAKTFAPNVIIAGALAKAGLRIYNHPVPHEGRRTGTASIVKWKLWRAAMRSFGQTLQCRPRLDNR
jgi:dolichol-phosphate mannosyltransferase